jgi:hypothetical protein
VCQRPPLRRWKREDRIDWFAAAFADPSKPELTLTFRNVVAPGDEWEAAAKKPVAIVVDGRCLEI